MSYRPAIPSVLGVFVLAGCSGSGDPGLTLPPPADPASITSQNAPVIASAVVTSALEGGELGAFASLGTLASPQMSGESGLIYAKAAELQLGYLESVKSAPAQSTEPVEATLGPEDTACSGGGTVTFTAVIRNEGTLTEGDTITFEFTDCVEGESTTNGMFAMNIIDFSGDFLTDFSFTVEVELTDFSVTLDGETATAAGTLDLTLAATQMGSSIEIGSDSFTVEAGGATHSLSGYLFAQTVQTNGDFTIELSGTLTSSAFSGAVDFETTVTLDGFGTAFAYGGEIVITGAENATITVTPVSETMVHLDIDLDGDGVPDESADLSWDELVG
jgi:hypothetical protein